MQSTVILFHDLNDLGKTLNLSSNYDPAINPFEESKVVDSQNYQSITSQPFKLVHYVLSNIVKGTARVFKGDEQKNLNMFRFFPQN